MKMKRKGLEKAFALTLCTAMACGMTAYADTVETGEVSTITLYPANANVQSGLVGGYKGDLFAKYGVAVEAWAYSDEKTNAILSSGDLPDVMYVKPDNLATMIESGMVLNLEDYLDKLPNITSNETMMTALNYTRQYRSAGTGELYSIPTVIGEKVPVTGFGNTKNMVVVNWDCYQSIGMPEIEDQWQLIDVMKQMLEKNPVGEDGTDNYGTLLNAGSDGEYWGNITQYFKWFGYEPTNLAYLLETDMINGELKSILDEESKYHEGLTWYNKVYREGLLDPDSINNDRQTQKSKVTNMHAMVTSGTLQGYSGYLPVYMPGEKLFQESWSSIYGMDDQIVISAKCKNIDAALAFVNMLADPNARFESLYGPEGDIWYLEDGVAYLSQEYIDSTGSTNHVTLKNGEQCDTWSIWVVEDSGNTTLMGPDGNPRPIKTGAWPEIVEKAAEEPRQKSWVEHFGYESLALQAMDAGNYFVNSDLDYIENFTTEPDDMMKLTMDAIRDKVVNASWQMVYAQTDEEFNSIWDKMVSDCEALGAQEIIDWRMADYEKAREIRDSLVK